MSIFRRASYDFVAQVAMQAVSLAMGIAIARLFDAEGKGLWQAVMLAATMGTAFANFGSRVANQFIVGKDPQRASQAHGVTLLLTLASTAACFAAVALFGPFLLEHTRVGRIPPDQLQLLAWAALVLPLMLYNYGWGGILIGLGRVRQLANFTFLLQLAQSAAWVAVLMAGGGIRGLLMAWGACWVCSVPAMLYLLRDHPPRLSGGVALMRQNLAYGLTAFSGNFAVNVMKFFNKSILLAQGSVAQFSVFTTADGYATKFFLHPEALEKGAFSSVTSTTREDAVRLVCRLVRLSLMMGLFVWGAGGVLASILLWLNGPQFVKGIVPLWLLMAGPVANSGSRMIAMFYSGQLGKPRIPSTFAWIGAGLNLLLVYAGLRLAGMPGAAAGTSLSHMLHFGLYLALFRRMLREHGMNMRNLLIVQPEDWPLLKQHLRRLTGNVLRLDGEAGR